VLGVVGCGAKSLKKLPKDWLSTTFGTFEGGSGRWAWGGDLYLMRCGWILVYLVVSPSFLGGGAHFKCLK